MVNNPVLIAYTVKDSAARKKAIWRLIGVTLPHDGGAGLTVLLDAVPRDDRIVLLEPKIDLAGIAAKPPEIK